MGFSPAIDTLVEALRVLPGIGPKSAQRIAFYLLEHDRDGAGRLAAALSESIEQVGECSLCRTLSELEQCLICANPQRKQQQLCIVESPADIQALEQTTGYQGLYFVLHGRLSPIDGIGPEEIGVEQLALRLQNGDISEVIIATNPTIEGEATAYYLAELVREQDILVSRLAHGIPMGGELEYVDGGTLAHAFKGRVPL
jgi:recombination protein RecR